MYVPHPCHSLAVSQNNRISAVSHSHFAGCLEHLPKSRQILCFDTLFHHTLPEHVFTYPLAPPAETPAIPLRKYGAHGLSYAYILGRMSEYLQKPQEELNLIIAHLGSGASMCLIKQGKSFDTTMGLTPLEGASQCFSEGMEHFVSPKRKSNQLIATLSWIGYG